MQVFVVMGNDFPDAVFDSEASAEAYCEKQRKEDNKHNAFAPRIYWRVYSFELNHERK